MNAIGWICVSALVLLLYGCVTTRYETGRVMTDSFQRGLPQ